MDSLLKMSHNRWQSVFCDCEVPVRKMGLQVQFIITSHWNLYEFIYEYEFMCTKYKRYTYIERTKNIV